MSTDVIGSRYRLGGVVTCTPESTTWQARDTWLDQRVLVVMPEPGCSVRFAALAAALMDRASAHLVGLYDIGTTLNDFVVFSTPAATFSDERVPREEEDVLVAGQALGDALEALHERGVVHGDLHPGSVTVAENGEAALSPWPLAPRPQNWSGPGGFGSDPDQRRDAAAEDDLRALGAVLLGALAGPPLLSSEQIENLERELAGRAPSAVAIADRALTPAARGGYEVAAELRDDCAAALSGQPVAVIPGSAPSSLVATRDDCAARSVRDTELSEGRRAALVVAVAGASVLAGLGLSGAFGATARLSVHPVSTNASGCVVARVAPPCAEPVPAVPGDPAGGPASVASPRTATPARLADHSVSASSASSVEAPGAPGSPATTPSTTGTRAPAASTTTTVPASTTTSSSPTTSSTTTSTSSTTSTTTPSSTTTTTSAPDPVQARPNGHSSGAPGSGLFGPGGGR